MDKPKWTSDDYRVIAHKSAGPYSAAVHICSVEMLQHAADSLDRITALESDAEVDAQLIRDKAKRIAELEAEVYRWKMVDSTRPVNIHWHDSSCCAAPPPSPAVRCSAGKHTCECGFHIDHCVAPAIEAGDAHGDFYHRKGCDNFKPLPCDCAALEIGRLVAILAALELPPAGKPEMPDAVRELINAFASWLKLCERCGGNGCEWCGDRGRAYIDPVLHHYAVKAEQAGKPEMPGCVAHLIKFIKCNKEHPPDQACIERENRIASVESHYAVKAAPDPHSRSAAPCFMCNDVDGCNKPYGTHKAAPAKESK